MSKEIKDLQEAALTNGSAWMALAEILIEKGYIEQSEFDILKDKYFQEMIKQAPR